MKAKETHVSRGVSPFITKVDASPIPSPIMKVCASPIPNIEIRALQRHVSILYAPYKAHSQLGHNSGGAPGMFLPCSYRFSLFEVPSKNLVVMN
jgi:hypothetical protein